MNLIKPKKLNKGDKIRIIAPSGPINKDKINLAKQYFEQKGYQVELGQNILKKQYYLAGSDNERLADLHEAFADTDTKAIICARGGYGALRLVDKIDYELIKQNPKIFCGYSDATILNAMLLKHANLITFSGPMAECDFGNKIDIFTKNSFFETLSGNLLEIKPTNPQSYNNVRISGILFGGNLASIASLCGKDFVPNCDFVFFTEDLHEPAYKIDRYFTQLLGNNTFKSNLKAIVLGDFLSIDNQEYLDYFLKSLSSELNIQIISGYPISHSKVKATIPYGAYCKLENNNLYINDYLI